MGNNLKIANKNSVQESEKKEAEGEREEDEGPGFRVLIHDQFKLCIATIIYRVIIVLFSSTPNIPSKKVHNIYVVRRQCLHQKRPQGRGKNENKGDPLCHDHPFGRVVGAGCRGTLDNPGGSGSI